MKPKQAEEEEAKRKRVGFPVLESVSAKTDLNHFTNVPPNTEDRQGLEPHVRTHRGLPKANSQNTVTSTP